MASYNFHQTDRNEDNGDTSYVSREFETDFLDRLVEEFFWFLRAAGFSYVEKVKVEYNDGESGAEFGSSS